MNNIGTNHFTPKTLQSVDGQLQSAMGFAAFRKGIRTLRVVACLAGTIAIGAHAATLVDTGTPTSTGSIVTSPREAIAAEFQLTRDTRVTGIEGYLALTGSRPGDLTISIFSDGGDNPAVELFSTSLTLGTADTSTGWRGQSGLGWDLSGGTYWAVFRSDANLAFGMPVGVAGVGGVISGGAPSPLGNEARLFNGGNIGYYWYQEPGDHLDFGVRIFGSDTRVSVPEAGSTLVLGSAGFLALVGMRRMLTLQPMNMDKLV